MTPSCGASGAPPAAASLAGPPKGRPPTPLGRVAVQRPSRVRTGEAPLAARPGRPARAAVGGSLIRWATRAAHMVVTSGPRGPPRISTRRFRRVTSGAKGGWLASRPLTSGATLAPLSKGRGDHSPARTAVAVAPRRPNGVSFPGPRARVHEGEAKVLGSRAFGFQRPSTSGGNDQQQPHNSFLHGSTSQSRHR